MERKGSKDDLDLGNEVAGIVRGGGFGKGGRIQDSRGTGGGTSLKLPGKVPAAKRAALKRAEAARKVQTEEKPEQPPAPRGHNRPPAEAKSNFALPKATKPPTKAEREQQQLDAALARVEESFKPYEGAKPNVPQEVFKRADTSRQGVDPVIQRATTDPAVKDKMMAAIERGKPLADWYNMEPTRLLWGDI